MAPVKKVRNQNGYGEKVQVKIITVDKERRRVECAMRDGAMVWAAVWETETVFRWPEVGETWTIRKDTGVWRLDQIVQTELGEAESKATPKTLEELGEGDTRIIGETVHMNDVTTSDLSATSLSASTLSVPGYFYDFGIVTSLPTGTIAKGSRCSYKVAAGHHWDLIYTGEATYPWAKIGGRPLLSTIYTEIQRTFAGFDGTGCPILTAPLAMEFNVVVEDTYAKLTTAPAGADGTLRAVYVSGVQKIIWQVNIGEPLFGGAQSVQRGGPLTMTKGQLIQSAYAVALGNTIGYVNMSLLIDPLRVG